MNKQEKIIVGLLMLLLVGWTVFEVRQSKRKMAEQAAAAALVEQNAPKNETAETTPEVKPAEPVAPVEPPKLMPATPETLVTLKNDEFIVTTSSHGGVVKSAVLSKYRELPAKDSDPVEFDFAGEPALLCRGVTGFEPNTSFDGKQESDTVVVYTANNGQGLEFRRRIELKDGYRIAITDTFTNSTAGAIALGANTLTLGSMHKGQSKNDTLGVDAMSTATKRAYYWESKLPGLFSGGASSGGMFGCAGSQPSANLPLTAAKEIDEQQDWVAVKTRFFAQHFSASDPITSYTIDAARRTDTETLQLSHIRLHVNFEDKTVAAGGEASREYTLYLGPKKLSLLRALGGNAQAVMNFGTYFGWLCVLLVPTLNFFYAISHNYGIAVILLTILVRIIFWPLTHRSTEGMKRMQALQPKLKALQAEFKDNPQKMQQETWQLYRENKVNPFASCLPMLVQIPVFIALFTVLRSAVELRYAPFLWITDLSEPENLFAGVLPIALNIWPILMAGTMALQSYLTPSMGDPAQQKMMMIMMPAMMLFMFYSMPSALCLYWTVSQVISIIQMLMQRRKAKTGGADGGQQAEVIPTTRQQRRAAQRT